MGLSQNTAAELPTNLPLDALTLAGWQGRLRAQLQDNILPYWREHMLDPQGGFYGGRSNDGSLRNDLPRSAVLGTRILWTFSSATPGHNSAANRAVADHAWQWLREHLWDARNGGVFWDLDASGQVLHDHKQSYAQGFAIYALAAYQRLTQQPEALQLAQELFEQLERVVHDPLHGGYFEGCSRDWQLLDDARLSPKEPWAAKSMNTMLHVMEAYTELLRCPLEATFEQRLRLRLHETVELFLSRIWQADARHFGLFFEADWTCLSDRISYGHDIEAAWLLQRAAELLGDTELIQRCRTLSLQVADAVLARGVASDGSILAEGSLQGVDDWHRHWWCQAEGMLGFWNAYEINHDPRYAQAAWACWRYIERHHVDHEHGEWFKVLDRQHQPLAGQVKTGPWECPYHHSRACQEMIERLQRLLDLP